MIHNPSKISIERFHKTKVQILKQIGMQYHSLTQNLIKIKNTSRIMKIMETHFYDFILSSVKNTQPNININWLQDFFILNNINKCQLPSHFHILRERADPDIDTNLPNFTQNPADGSSHHTTIPSTNPHPNTTNQSDS
jgi:hypothetical protein